MSKKNKILKKLQAKSATEEAPLEAVEPESEQDAPEESVIDEDEQLPADQDEHPLDLMPPEEARLQPDRFDAEGKRIYDRHEEVRVKSIGQTNLDNAGLTIALAATLKEKLYGVDAKGQTKLPYHARFALRCPCGKLLTFCDEWPVHHDNRLREWTCPECRFTIPFKDGARREYDPRYCRTIDDEIKAELAKERLAEINAVREAKGLKPSR